MNRLSALLTLTLFVAPALADDVTPAKGTVLEVQVSVNDQGEETIRIQGGEADTSKTQQQLEARYLERIDEVREGLVTKVTRHYLSATAKGEQGADALELAGRQVTITRAGEGELSARWSNGQRLGGAERRAVLACPWPQLDKGWQPERGDRQGELKQVSLGDWVPPAEIPPALASKLLELPLSAPCDGSWSLKVEGDLRPTGKLAVSFSVAGKEQVQDEQEPYEVEAKRSYSLKLERRPASVAALPEASPPPEDPGSWDGEEGPDDQGPGMEPDGDDDDMGEPDGPAPNDDDDDDQE